LDLTGSDRADLQREWRASQARAPLVSIVVPTYNATRYLRSEDSVIAQTFEDWGLPLIEDGSRDKTMRLSQQSTAASPKIRAVEDTHGGPAVARNQGLRHSDPQSKSVISKRLLAHA